MSNLNSTLYRRVIRIEGKPGDLEGFKIKVTDTQTGELIRNIKSVTVYLHATETNKADVTYYETDEDGAILVQDGEAVHSHLKVHNPDIDVTAFEKMDALEQLVFNALIDVGVNTSRNKTLDVTRINRIGADLVKAIKKIKSE